jgi:hypothetical protein
LDWSTGIAQHSPIAFVSAEWAGGAETGLSWYHAWTLLLP